jgi:hypothetical protein
VHPEVVAVERRDPKKAMERKRHLRVEVRTSGRLYEEAIHLTAPDHIAESENPNRVEDTLLDHSYPRQGCANFVLVLGEAVGHTQWHKQNPASHEVEADRAHDPAIDGTQQAVVEKTDLHVDYHAKVGAQGLNHAEAADERAFHGKLEVVHESGHVTARFLV